MIKGPWPMTADNTGFEVPLEPPFITPMYRGDRVALRVSAVDKRKLRRGAGVYGTITDLDTGKQYRLEGRVCEAGSWCYCDAEISDEHGSASS